MKERMMLAHFALCWTDILLDSCSLHCQVTPDHTGWPASDQRFELSHFWPMGLELVELFESKEVDQLGGATSLGLIEHFVVQALLGAVEADHFFVLLYLICRGLEIYNVLGRIRDDHFVENDDRGLCARCPLVVAH